MAIPSPSQQKSELRNSLRRLRHDAPQESRSIRKALSNYLAEHPDLAIIATFSAIPGEPDLTEITTLHPDRTWVFPRVSGDSLTFHAVRNPSLDLAPGAFGIMEPLPTLAEIPAHGIDAFLCPGLAFDPRGGRLGRGRGFYDRILSEARPDALKIGVCFPSRLVPDTHSEPHDIHMDEVISGALEAQG